jgi:hypothetical protein
MKSRMKIIGLTAIALIYGTSPAMSMQPVSHDHQKSKTHRTQSADSGTKSSSKCKPDNTDSLQGTSTKSEATNNDVGNCNSKKASKPTHDHRDMKNL